MIPITPAVIPPKEHRPIFDVETVAAATNESPATVRRRCVAGQYPHSRFGRAFRFSETDILVILTNARRGPVTDTPLYDEALAATR